MPWWPAIVLAVATAILQSHAIPYWTAQAGPWGWLWSPGAELLAWWFLSRGGWSRVVGVLAAAVVVGGPLAQMTLPMVTEAKAEARQAESLEDRVRALEQDIQAARERAEDHRSQAAELRHYSDGRHGRQVELAQVAEEEASRLRERRRELQAELGSRDPSGLSAPEHFHLGLHAGILIVAWLGSMSAVTALSGRTEHYVTGNLGGGVTPTEHVGERAEMARNLGRYMKQEGITQKDVADAAGVSRPEVGRVLSHERLMAEGERTASYHSFSKLVKFLEEVDGE